MKEKSKFIMITMSAFLFQTTKLQRKLKEGLYIGWQMPELNNITVQIWL